MLFSWSFRVEKFCKLHSLNQAAVSFRPLPSRPGRTHCGFRVGAWSSRAGRRQGPPSGRSIPLLPGAPPRTRMGEGCWQRPSAQTPQRSPGLQRLPRSSLADSAQRSGTSVSGPGYFSVGPRCRAVLCEWAPWPWVLWPEKGRRPLPAPAASVAPDMIPYFSANAVISQNAINQLWVCHSKCSESLLFQAAFPNIRRREPVSEGESAACVLRGLSAGLEGGVKVLGDSWRQ